MQTVVASTFIELLIFTAPGFVVLFSLKVWFPEVSQLFEREGVVHWTQYIPILFMAIATAIVVSGITTLATGMLYDLKSREAFEKLKKDGKLPSGMDYESFRVSRVQRIFEAEEHQRDTLSRYYKSFESCSRMATALSIATISMVLSFLIGTNQSTPLLGYIIPAAFTVLMILASRHMGSVVIRMSAALEKISSNAQGTKNESKSNSTNESDGIKLPLEEAQPAVTE